MINNNILLSKIVANASEKSWAKAYSTLNLYIILSIDAQTTGEETIASQGKEILERLQREFFALDQKDLKSIKTAVENAVGAINDSLEYSVAVATIINNILYIITASSAAVVIKRKGNLGIVARGEEGKIISFSGILEDHDTVIIGTAEFFKKVPVGLLKSLLSAETVTLQAENIAPIIHGNSCGTEAAMILQFRRPLDDSPVHKKSEHKEDGGILAPDTVENTKEKRSLELPLFAIPRIPISVSRETLQKLLKNKVALIGIGIIVLVLILALSLFAEKKKTITAANQTLLESILTPAQKKYDDAIALMSLNKSLAIDELAQVKQSLQKDRNQFAQGSAGQKKVDILIAKIDSALGQGPNSASPLKNQKILIDGTRDKDLKQLAAVTYKGQALSVVDLSSGIVAIVPKDDGNIQTKISTDAKNPKFITGDKGVVYIIGQDATYKVDIGAKKTAKLFDISGFSNIAGVDTFLGNLYILNRSDKNITKYLAGSSNGAPYLPDGAIANTPLSLSIDSSIWVAEEGGVIQKFTKGKPDSLTLKGVSKPLGNNLLIYTDVDYANVYILDGGSARIVSIDKTGVFSAEYSNKIFQNAASFAVDEVSRRIFVISSNKLYSFDF